MNRYSVGAFALGGIATVSGLAGLLGVACLAAAQAAQPAAADQTKWNVEVSLGECTLTGSTPGADPVQVSLLTVTGSDAYDLSLVGKAVPRTPEHNSFPVTIVFGGSGERLERTARGTRIDRELGNAIVVDGLGPEVTDAFAKANAIGLEGKTRVAPVSLSHARAAVAALDGCVRDQLVEWGADPAQFEPGGKKPVALIPRNDWLSKKDWDVIEPREGAVDVMFRVSVAADGTIDGCTPVGPAPAEKVQTTACGAVMTRRLFTPARDAAGKAVHGVAVFEIHIHVSNSITATAI